MNNDWTNKLREQLANHEEPVSDDLWASIEAQLDAQPSPSTAQPSQPDAPLAPAARTVRLRRWGVAAAIALLLATGGYLLFPSRHPALPPVAQVSPKAVQGPTPDAVKSSTPEAVQGPTLAEVQGSIAEAVQGPTPETVQEATPEPVQGSKPEPVQDSTPKAVQGPTLAEDQNSTPEAAQRPEPETVQEANHSTPLPHREGPGVGLRQGVGLRPGVNHSLSFSLYASNGLTNQQAQNPVLMSQAMAMNYAELNDISQSSRRGAPQPIMLTNFSEKTTHKMPFSVGLSVACSLADRWILQTGLAYTRTESEFTSRMSNSTVTTQQRLHYLGIPLQMRYDFWQRNSLTTYAAAGAQADVNVSAERKTEGVDVEMHCDRLQFSLSAAIGLQYNILPAVGFFGEASLRYYPDNGSTVQNYFKDKPLSPSLQAGIRLNVNR